MKAKEEARSHYQEAIKEIPPEKLVCIRPLAKPLSFGPWVHVSLLEFSFF